jgi:hypothetical protein
MRRALLISAAAVSFAFASPANAALTVEGACDLALTSPDAVACAGYYSSNLLSNNATDLVDQQTAIASLPGDITFDGDFNALTKIEALVNGNQINFGTTLFDDAIIGAHFGNVVGVAGNVSVFWLFDLPAQGANFIALDNTQGFSNAVLYTRGTPAVPEPATWAMMLVGFGFLGGMLRRRGKVGPRVRFA